MIGSTIENYKIVGLLGEGGMGIVYRAFDCKLERYVAIKILSHQATKSTQFVERFKREAKNQAKLNHSNIVPVYGFTEQDGMLGIVMELVEGETLEKVITRKGKLELKESLGILKQLLTGVDYAHKKGFIHRDIKPSNVIISSEGIVKIMDFGISKALNELNGITKTGTKIGTILYMSPEQIKAQEPSAQSDIYSIGITFYEMLVGVTPFDSNTEYSIMESHLKKNPPRISGTNTNIPAEADRIINKALAKFLSKRYQNCEEFITDIDSLLASLNSAEVKANEPRKKEKEIVNAADHHPKSAKLRFFVFAFLFISIFVFLIIVVYDAVSSMWQRNNNGEVTEQIVQETKQLPQIKFSNVFLDSKASLSSVAFLNDSVGIASGSECTVLRSTDGGRSWGIVLQDSALGNLFKVCTIENNLFISGENGLLLNSTDLGNSWRRINTGFTNSFFNIGFANYNTGFITGSKGLLLKTTNGGADWKQISVPINKNLFGIFVNPITFELYISGWEGAFLKSTDLGNSWNINTSISDKYLKSIYFTDDNRGFAVGGGGEILKTVNAGIDWEKVETDVISGLMKIFFVNKYEGYILGMKGEILYTSDAGESWITIPSGTYFSLSDLTIYKPGKFFIAGYNGTLLTN